MTKKERLKRMISGMSIDYFPSSLEFVPARRNSLLKELKMTPSEFDQYADNHIFFFYPLTEAAYYSSGNESDNELERYAVSKGVIRQHPDKQYLYDNFGTTWFKNPVGVRDTGNPLKGVEDISSYKWPTAYIDDLFSHFASNDIKSEYLYSCGLQHLTIWERGFLLLGYENMLLDLYLNPERVNYVMDKITEFHVELANEFVKTETDSVRIGDDYGTQKALQMPPDIWRKSIGPRLKKIYSVYKGAGITIMQHSCGCITEIIPDLINMGLDVLHPIQPLAMDIKYLANEYGKDLTFFGGIDTQQLLPYSKPEEVRSAVRQCVDILGRHGKYIIAPSQEIMLDVPTENIIALIEAIREFRAI